MKILIIGGGGMLGHKLTQVLQNRFDCWTTLRAELQCYEQFNVFDSSKTCENIDAENDDLLRGVVRRLCPQVIINAVGIVKQVPTTNDAIKAISVNSLLPHRLAEIAADAAARFITISTDCVFDGKKGNYTEEDRPDAEDLYGKSKNLGEVTTGDSLTLRTSIIGRELKTRHGLVEWFLSNEGKSVKGYKRAVFSGFPTVVLANLIGDIIERHPSLRGLYHVSSNPINKYDLLHLIKNAYGANIEIEPFEDFEIDRSLDSEKFRRATGFQPTDWRTMIETMAADNKLYTQ